MAIRDRQVEILNLVKWGKTNKEIAKKLFLAHDTVRTHMVNIMRELKARNRAHAVYIAIKQGIIQ